MPERLATRIFFDAGRETMEVDFSGLSFLTAEEVDRIYDAIEDLIANSGDDKWYFLVNLQDTRIDSTAWLTYARRGRLLNEKHSLGSVRYDASPATQAEIASRAGAEDFDANLCPDRDSALVRIAELRAAAPKRFRVKSRPKSEWGEEEFASRTRLYPEIEVMEADFSDFQFRTIGDVHDFYDYLDHRMRVTGKRWFFLVNYQGTRIDSDVWYAFAARGKKLNRDFSRGSVRYDASPETAAEIAERANTESFDPNLFASRDDALGRIEEMKRAEMAGP